jgi:hypothetical protein
MRIFSVVADSYDPFNPDATDKGMSSGTAHGEVYNRPRDMDYVLGWQIDSFALPLH